MIISASRRTDIPAYYSYWFYNRIKEGFVLTRNPRNYKQVSKISLAPDMIDGIVLWTKNPLPMLDRLDELEKYMYYFHFTITAYGNDIEPKLPHKTDTLLPAFKSLSKTIGAGRVIWRYDPILLNEKYTMDYHICAFEKIAAELSGFTQKVVISFIETDYRGVKGNTKELALNGFPIELKMELASRLAQIAIGKGLAIEACAQSLELTQYGIGAARCIDGGLLSKLLGYEPRVKKDKNQRPFCGCTSSVDIGVYNTCGNGCKYCYANYNPGTIANNAGKHKSQSAFMIDETNCSNPQKTAGPL